ncbi:MAG TPA: asparagine synthase (glutamine-hydrolyzing) [Tepidisphaeraceae bacterium]|nr:asparagine synthase (glutamine-hydrolyzing) [Tepidisphaeraceae bacterium]
MCGIAGILGRVNDANRAALRRMAACLSHRGPDCEAFWDSAADASTHNSGDADGFGVMLAHRRLSILDLSTAATQPMTDPVTGQTIIFNGEIYNYVELRRELTAAGETFGSTGDTAVMLRLLSLGGPESVRKLRGMFAFALWDPRHQRLTIARDPLGIKPLYLCRNPDPTGDWSLLIASELRAILASKLIGTPKLNPHALASVVWNGFVMGPETAVRGVELLPPGEIRAFDARGKQTYGQRYWTNERPAGPAISEEQLRHEIRQSVRLHLASDVPLGVFLSSGVDSSAVANLAQKVSEQPINTFTLAFEEQELSEGAHAKRIAEAIGTTHHEILLTESMFVDNIDLALDTLDQPTFDGLNSFYMSKAVREAGLTVALVGTGGDELFGGYTSFRELPRLHAAARRSSWLPRGAKVAAAKALAYAMQGSAGSGGGSVPAQTRWAKLPDMVRSGDDVIGLYQLAYALFLPGFQRQLIADGLVNGSVISGVPREMHDLLAHEVRGRSPLSAIAVLEQRCFLGERLLRDTDAASMAVSLEVRLPLVDQVVVEQVNRLPDAVRFEPVRRKAILRRVGLEGLDPNLFDRPKSGFVLPYDRWIRQRLGGQMDELMRDERAAAAVGLQGKTLTRLWNGFRSNQGGLYWSRVWALYVLMRWCHRHGVFV